MSHDIFISYSTKDDILAGKICHVLEQNNLKCWIAPRNIDSGKPYAAEIVEGIRIAKIVVLVFSKDAQNSKYVRKEIENAFDLGKSILTFKIDEMLPDKEFSYWLNNDQWLEAHPNPEDNFDKLIEDSLSLCGEDPDVPIWWSLKDFVPNDLSKQKRDYPSLILLFTPFYWASFIYMGLVADVNLWKLMGFVYLVPSLVCVILFYQIWGVLFIFYHVFALASYIFIIFWILAIIHGFLIRNEFLTRRSVLRFMSSNDELFNLLYDEYSKIRGL